MVRSQEALSKYSKYGCLQKNLSNSLVMARVLVTITLNIIKRTQFRQIGCVSEKAKMLED